MLPGAEVSGTLGIWREKHPLMCGFSLLRSSKVGQLVVYAVVRAGGRQEKVEVGSIITVDRLSANAKNAVSLEALLLVDGDKVTHDAKALAKVSVTAEVLNDLRGPKITIHKFKNKTGYHKRQGFRAELTRLKVTGISAQ